MGRVSYALPYSKGCRLSMYENVPEYTPAARVPIREHINLEIHKFRPIWWSGHAWFELGMFSNLMCAARTAWCNQSLHNNHKESFYPYVVEVANGKVINSWPFETVYSMVNKGKQWNGGM